MGGGTKTITTCQNTVKAQTRQTYPVYIYKCIYVCIFSNKGLQNRKHFVLNKLVNISLLALWGEQSICRQLSARESKPSTHRCPALRGNDSAANGVMCIYPLPTRGKNNIRRESSCYTHRDNSDTRDKTETRSLQEIKTKSTYTLEVCGCSLQRS